MRIVSMVPSWTEMLLAAGADVVGRTRFCIHPADKVRNIPIVGGTKDVKWNKVRALDADLLLLDREENPSSMRDESPIEVLATHILDVRGVASDIDRIAQCLSRRGDANVANALGKLGERWRAAGEHATNNRPLINWNNLPGVIEWVRNPPAGVPASFVYLIWRDPWMAIGRDTFIASMLEAVGLPRANLLPQADQSKYPVVDTDILPDHTVILASTEPFPFHRKREEILALNRPAAIVDGESFSWFGVRSLEFLEQAHKTEPF